MASLTQLSHHSLMFPPVDQALQQPNGLLASGGDLSIARLLAAYEQGIFPWFTPEEPILWWSPDPRAVLVPAEIHTSRSMKRFLRQSPYHFTLNCAFSAVITACAEQRHQGTWIGYEVIQAYCQLHKRGHAHSVEVWQGRELVGGLYGLALGALFCGESMFSRRDNASKSALILFAQHFNRHGGKLIDCQVINAHTASLGAKEVRRSHFLQQLDQLQCRLLPVEFWQSQSLSMPE